MRICVVLCAQEYNYVHYDTKDGLAGSTVYDITQDQDGFLWFATESGVSRYDGSHFRNFTTADGLPETEVLRVYADRQGRVWIAPFKNSICYYFKGKLYTQENDSLLKKIKVNGFITSIQEDACGNLGFRSGDFRSFVITGGPQPEVYSVDSIHPGATIDGRFWNGTAFILHSASEEKNGYTVDTCFSLINKKVKEIGHIRRSHEKISVLWNDSILKVITPIRGFKEIDHVARDKFFWNTTNGSWLTSTLDIRDLRDVFLKSEQITHSFIDNEGSYWFGTMGKGLYKLPSTEFRTYSLNKTSSETFSLARQGDHVLAGGLFGKLYEIAGKKVQTHNYNVFLFPSLTLNSSNRVTAIARLSSGRYLLGSDGFLCVKDPPGKTINYMPPVKSIEELDSGKVLVATNKSVVILDSENLKVLDTIWNLRSTAASSYANSFFIGTTEGLYIEDKNKSITFWGDSIAPLRYRIGALAKSADGKIWIATYGSGIIGMKGRQVIAHLTTANGLTSDACRALYVEGHFLWVGTDKGLNKVNIENSSYPIIWYNQSDGLPSNTVNSIIADSGKVYIASPAGVTVFDENKIERSSECRLKVFDINVSDRPQPLTTSYRLHYWDNNFRIEFVAISFKSGANITYRYRLKGLTDNWDSTRQNLLAWPSLPSGDYELQIVAVNKFGVVSKPVNITFSIDTPFWKTAWFSLLVVAAIIAATSFLITRRFKALRKREQERAAVLQKVSNLEQLALRAQMNPHFIFNCLNSIQNFIISRDLKTTNEYLTGFADLIRQTLHNSEKGTLSLRNEMRYLERYLELEKMRFGNSFSYSIEVTGELDVDATSIPPMILQPYVENSIRHGVRYIKNGHIRVRFSMDADGLRCMVEDNGIGRKKAMEYRSVNMHVEYQSKGMSLTADRIDALNRQFMESVTIHITDLFNENDLPAGTRIVIHFPWSILTKFELHDEDRYHRR